MSFCQFSVENTQIGMLAGAIHSIVQQWQLFEISPAELCSIQNMCLVSELRVQWEPVVSHQQHSLLYERE